VQVEERGSEALDIIAFLSSQRKAIRVEILADLLDVSKQAIYEHIKRGTLPAVKVGSTVRINPKDAVLWCESRMTVQPKSPTRRAA